MKNWTRIWIEIPGAICSIVGLLIVILIPMFTQSEKGFFGTISHYLNLNVSYGFLIGSFLIFLFLLQFLLRGRISQHLRLGLYTKGFVSHDFYTDIFQRAQNRIIIAGTTQIRIIDSRLICLLIKKADKGCRIHIIYFNPFSSYIDFHRFLTRTPTSQAQIKSYVISNSCRLKTDISQHPNAKGNFHIYYSKYSNLVPFVAADESIYFSTPFIANAQNGMGLGDGPYIRTSEKGAWGERLTSHIQWLLQDALRLPAHFIDFNDAQFVSDLEKFLRNQQL